MHETSDRKTFFCLILYLAVVLGVTFFIIHFIGQRTVVIGSSMEPALEDGDNLIVDKVTYRFKNPQRFDIIVFPQGEEEYYIKRIIGLPGERIQIGETGLIYINGEPLQEAYGKEVIRNPGDAAEELTLAEDEYFVLGDNRNDSLDSRDAGVGRIKRQDIIGRAWLRVYPFNKMKWLTP